ncbi:clusterin-associated 1 [Chlorella sorokiniana]|uniref:Clusterin-associated 1 n=1 Tax=Chlorella sorokiniana TaxID=3076 RepID=A0A2P6TP19_CHLSO|nr:clusterin-associated 1 [Chlorella sorokiniana]|eukprot:PRW51072.1 clusterin-associated 1 [Chlorella sorokiniana]
MDAGGDLQALMEELGALGCPLRAAPPSLGTRAAFDWVSEALLWLCQRAAPELAVQRDCSSEAKRVAFLAALGAQFFAATRVRLNLRRLHRAGGGAVRELRRLAAALRQAAESVEPAFASPAAPQLQCEAGELRALAQRVGASASKLVGALAAGPPAEASVAEAAAACADVDAAEAALQAALAEAQAQATQLEAAVAALGQEAAVMEGRVERRHAELDRVERRLDALHAVRPAHSAEAEALEGQLSELYQAYLHMFRNLEYLEAQADKRRAARQAEADEAERELRRIQRQVAADELRLLQGDQGSRQAPVDSEDSEEQGLGSLGGWGRPKALPRLAGGLGGGSPAAAAAVLGLQLLPEDSGSAAASPAGSPTGAARSRLSGVSGAGEDDLDGGGRAVRFAVATTIPAHRPEAGGGPARPARARRTTGSGNALLKKAAAGGGSSAGAADVLVVEEPAVAAGRRSWLGTGGDNDF